MVHVQSPCTTYNDTFELIKGNARKGIDPLLYEVPEDHDASNRGAAYDLIQRRGVPMGVIYRDSDRPSLEQRLEEIRGKARERTVEELMDSFAF